MSLLIICLVYLALQDLCFHRQAINRSLCWLHEVLICLASFRWKTRLLNDNAEASSTFSRFFTIYFIHFSKPF